MAFGRVVQSIVWGLSTAASEKKKLSEFNNGRKLTKNSTEDIKSNCCLAKKAKTVETFREAIKKIINKTRVRENSRLFEHEYYSSTGNPFNLPFCFELTDKGYTLLKHRELLACVVDCNSFETACFLKDLQLLLIDTPTQWQNECTCSVDKARSFPSLLMIITTLYMRRRLTLCLRCRCCVENASKLYTLGSGWLKPNNMAATTHK